jgi:hypothetical protein
MGIAPILNCDLPGCNPLQEQVGKTSQVFPATEIVNNVYTRGVPDPVQTGYGIPLLSAYLFLKEKNPRHKVVR